MITDQLLGLLKIVLLLALYAFFARVLWAVWNEIRIPAVSRVTINVANPEARPEMISATAPKVSRQHRVGSLRIIAPADMKGIVVDLGSDDVIIGRDEICALQLAPDTGVSARHAVIRRIDGYVTIEDLGSTNHTSVNGKQISSPTRLRVGDRVHIGLVTLEVER
jgi:hypothetical protein